MADSPQKRRMLVIGIVGVAACTVALGMRLMHNKPIHGVWLGYGYYEENGKLVQDSAAGQYVIKLHANGTYEENSNATSGKWTRKGDLITLVPVRFYDQTPDEHRNRMISTKGKVSETMKMLLEMKMKPILVNYSASTDRLFFKEPTLHYEFQRVGG
jgi:hypothetical protein